MNNENNKLNPDIIITSLIRAFFDFDKDKFLEATNRAVEYFEKSNQLDIAWFVRGINSSFVMERQDFDAQVSAREKNNKNIDNMIKWLNSKKEII